jgi:lysophospholipase L1-like esterase
MIRSHTEQDAGEVTKKLLVFADSLGLPRTADKTGEMQGAESTYPWLLGEPQGSRIVESVCQRFFTTDSIVDTLRREPKLGAGHDVVVHVGLNDCSNRMFLADERLALGLLPQDVREAVVGFAQKFRRQIIRNLPSRHYVDIARFRQNLDFIVSELKARRARKVILTTIILPPPRFWAGTPGMNANFAAYNLEIMRAAERNNAVLFDLDRLVWHAIADGPLVDDGMHLSPVGHRLFADKCLELLGV